MPMVLRRESAAVAKEHLRSEVRVDLHVPVVFEWRERGRNDGKRHAAGVTLNISPEGLYVVSEVGPPTQVVARCRLVLPPLQAAKTAIKGYQPANHEWVEFDCDFDDMNEPDSGYEAVVIGRVVRNEVVGEQRVGFAVQARVMILRQFDRALIP